MAATTSGDLPLVEAFKGFDFGPEIPGSGMLGRGPHRDFNPQPSRVDFDFSLKLNFSASVRNISHLAGRHRAQGGPKSGRAQEGA
jgi:hypothetical protein